MRHACPPPTNRGEDGTTRRSEWDRPGLAMAEFPSRGRAVGPPDSPIL
jgi:hypothetical protein